MTGSESGLGVLSVYSDIILYSAAIIRSKREPLPADPPLDPRTCLTSVPSALSSFLLLSFSPSPCFDAVALPKPFVGLALEPLVEFNSAVVEPAPDDGGYGESESIGEEAVPRSPNPFSPSTFGGHMGVKGKHGLIRPWIVVGRWTPGNCWGICTPAKPCKPIAGGGTGVTGGERSAMLSLSLSSRLLMGIGGTWGYMAAAAAAANSALSPNIFLKKGICFKRTGFSGYFR